MLLYLNQLAKNYEYLIKSITAFLPFLIALFMAYIAYQQWQTNEIKRKQELFELRHQHLYYEPSLIIEKIKELISNNYTCKKTEEYEDYVQIFWRNIFKYRFLISKEDGDKLIEIIKDSYSNFWKKYSTKSNNYLELLDFEKDYQKAISNIMEPYLRIEPNNMTIWELCKLYYFIIPKILRIKIKEIVKFNNKKVNDAK